MKKVLFFALLIMMTMTTIPAMAELVPFECGSYPSVVEYGQSYCITVCANTAASFQLIGALAGPDAVPLFVFRPGCDNCGVNRTLCVPLTDLPNHYTRQPSTPPGHWDYVWETDCITITVYFVHDTFEPTWSIDIFSHCDGCFCLTFDRQEAVELSSFSAESNDNAITLHWSTASETESSQWLIHRSESESGDFTFANQLPAAGTTTQTQNYSWTDNHVVSGRTYYYRLSEQDVSGQVTTLDRIVHAELTSTIGSLPNEYSLAQNYPNPFNPTTEISFSMKETGFVSLKVYNMIGQEVAVLVSSEVAAGSHVVRFNASNLPSAIYLCKMEAQGFTATSKMLLMK